MQGAQNKLFPIKTTVNCGGKLVDLFKPKVMGILNVTPDSFYDGGLYDSESALLKQAEKHLAAGASFLDMGAVSTRPRSAEVSIDEELRRLLPALVAVKKAFPESIISADTFRANVAQEAVAAGADLINDISGGTMDKSMFDTVAQLRVPYVMMHIQGTPQSMQDHPTYVDVVNEVFDFFKVRCAQLRSKGVSDIILDLGFGFGKTLDHNYALLNATDRFRALGYPILSGLSRKSMINKVLGTKADEALNGTSALNVMALMRGTSILRVHDVKEAMEVIKLHAQLESEMPS